MMNTAFAKDEVVLDYRGGSFCILAAVYLLKEFKRVTLLTAQSHKFLSLSKDSKRLLEDLRERYGERITHRFLEVRQIYDKIRERKELFSDIYKYGLLNRLTNFCVPCNLAVNTAGIIYCLEYGIPYYAKGISILGGEDVYEHTPLGVKDLVEWGNKFGIELLFPVYNTGRPDRELVKLGIISESDAHFSQNRCPLPIINTVYRRGIANSIAGTRQVLETTRGYCYKKQNTVCKTYVEGYFQKKELDIGKLTNKLREHRLRQKEIVALAGVSSAPLEIANKKLYIPRRTVIDNIGAYVTLTGLLLGTFVGRILGKMSIGIGIFLITWFIFIYNYKLIRTKLKPNKNLFVL